MLSIETSTAVFSPHASMVQQGCGGSHQSLKSSSCCSAPNSVTHTTTAGSTPSKAVSNHGSQTNHFRTDPAAGSSSTHSPHRLHTAGCYGHACLRDRSQHHRSPAEIPITRPSSLPIAPPWCQSLERGTTLADSKGAAGRADT